MTFSDEQVKQLTAKLDSSNVQPPKQFGPKGHYLEGWLVIAEANRIFGFDGWSYEVVSATCVNQSAKKIGKEQKDGFAVTYTAKVRAAVSDVIREDFGAGHGYDLDLGLAHESAIKEAVTDALKRTLRTFGNPFGLALYDKSRENVADEAEIARSNAIESLWAELCELRSEAGLKSFWMDNAKGIAGMDPANKARFTRKKDELKAAFEKPRDVVDDIQDTFPGAEVVNVRTIRDMHPLEAG